MEFVTIKYQQKNKYTWREIPQTSTDLLHYLLSLFLEVSIKRAHLKVDLVDVVTQAVSGGQFVKQLV